MNDGAKYHMSLFNEFSVTLPLLWGVEVKGAHVVQERRGRPIYGGQHGLKLRMIRYLRLLEAVLSVGPTAL